jgi:hypothetical protein
LGVAVDAAHVGRPFGELVSGVIEADEYHREHGNDGRFKDLVQRARNRWGSLEETLRQHPDLATERLHRVLETMNIILEQLEALTRVPGRPPR